MTFPTTDGPPRSASLFRLARALRVPAALALAIATAPHRAHADTPPPYAELFRLGASWRFEGKLTDALGVDDSATPARSLAGPVQCTVTKVRTLARIRVASVTCDGEPALGLIAGDWLSTSRGLWRAPTRVTTAARARAVVRGAPLLAASPRVVPPTDKPVARSISVTSEGDRWCATVEELEGSAARSVRTCFAGGAIVSAHRLAESFGEGGSTSSASLRAAP